MCTEPKPYAEIEVTPEMVEAGCEAIGELELSAPTIFDVSARELRLMLPVAFDAMLRARR